MAYEQESPLYNGNSNNTVPSADGLTSGVKMVAALASASDVDFFRINTSGPSLITLDFLSPLLTTSSHWQVRLLDANGDYLRMLASSVQGTPLVNGASESGTSLKVDGLSSVPAAGSQFTLVTSGADTTVYKVVSATALVGGGSTLTLDKALPSGLSDNTPLAFDPAQLVTGVSSSVTASVPAAGTYSIQVLADGAVWNSADYALTATVTPTVEKEGTGGNNTKDDAAFASNRLLANTSMTGALSGASDVDYWVFTTAKPSDFTVSFGSSSSASSPEWKIDVTQWSGAPLSGGSLSAGSSASLSLLANSFAEAQTFVVAVSPFSSTAFNTGNYTLKVAGSGLDLNDAPVLSVGTVSIRVPEPGVVVDTLVVRNVSAGSSTAVRLDSLFSATDPDATSSGQSVSYYRFSLTKDSGLSSDAAVQLVSGGLTKSYGFGAGMLTPGSVILTAAEMATAVFLPGSTAAGSTLKLALQAYDSTSTLSDLGGADGSGASAILQQTLKIVSGSVGVTLDSSATKTTLSESLKGEGSSKPNSSSFSVVLNQAPTHDVKFYLTDANDQLDLSSTVLTFTSANFATAQSVSISATADSKTEGASQSAPLRFQVVSQDSSYDGFLVSPLTFSVADNAAPVLVTPTAIGYTDTQAQDSFSAPATGSVSGTLSASDANGDTLSYGILGGTDAATTVSKTSSLGTLTVTKATGAYVFSPDADGLDAAAGNTSEDFIVTVSDGTTSSSKALTVSVTGVNDTPILEFIDPSAPLLERGGAGNSVAGISDAQVTLSLFDAESSVSLDAAGLLTLGWGTTNMGVTYTRAGNFGTATINSSTLQLAYVLNDNDPRTQGLEDRAVDTDVFWVQVRDAQGLISKTSFIFGVTGANDWPVLTAISDRVIAPGQALSFDLKNELSDADSNLTVSATLADGTPLPAWLGFNSTSLTFSGTPAESDLALLSILVVASDGADGTVFDNFEITVAAASQNAVLLADSKAGNEDGGVISGNVLSNDTAPVGEGNSLSLITYSVTGFEELLDAGQTFTITGKGDVRMNSNGSYTFTPLPNIHGVMPVITYDTNDGSSTLTLTVSPVDDASVLAADTKTVVEGSTASGNVLLNDSDIDNTLAVASFRVAGNQTVFNAGQTATLANQGTLLVQADGGYVFTPLTDFNGAVSQVTYTLNTGSSSTLGIRITSANAPAGVDVEVQAYAWKSHVLLNEVDVSLNAAASVKTAGQGKVVFSDVVDPASLTASRSATDTYSEGAVNLQDAIAILKLVVGLPVNGTNQALSPYQMFAADYNGNGSVELSDAIDVLKYVVGLPGTQPSWKFLNETTSVGSLTALPTQPGTLPVVELPVDNNDASLRVGLVGFLRGDVDGSYAGAPNAEALSSDYFRTLATEHALNASQFGVY